MPGAIFHCAISRAGNIGHGTVAERAEHRSIQDQFMFLANAETEHKKEWKRCGTKMVRCVNALGRMR